MEIIKSLRIETWSYPTKMDIVRWYLYGWAFGHKKPERVHLITLYKGDAYVSPETYDWLLPGPANKDAN